MTAQQSKWNADAEAAMMGFVIPVESEMHLKHITGYVLRTLQGMCQYNDFEEKTKEVLDRAQNKYNSEGKPISYFTVNDTLMGTMLTFVRDKKQLVLKSGKSTASGSLAWVENLEYPDCSELGYVYFARQNGKIRRIA